jgi:hypothetical protein
VLVSRTFSIDENCTAVQSQNSANLWMIPVKHPTCRKEGNCVKYASDSSQWIASIFFEEDSNAERAHPEKS